jgi:hypothetical protein
VFRRAQRIRSSIARKIAKSLGEIFSQCVFQIRGFIGYSDIDAAVLMGATDEQLPGTLGISVPAIKKTWASVYHRVAEHLSELVCDALQSGCAPRGREKRRDLLAYLREHPEELRPVITQAPVRLVRGWA